MAAKKKGVGQPSKINAVVGQRADGTDILVTDQIIGALRSGSYLEPAILAAGLGKETVYGWIRVAGKARIRTRGEMDDASLTDHERECIAFSDAVHEAENGWEVRTNHLLESIGRGGLEQKVVTIKTDADGNEIERTERITHTLPDPRVLEWRLERRFMERYGHRVEVEVKHGELTVDERAEALIEALSLIEDLESTDAVAPGEVP